MTIHYTFPEVSPNLHLHYAPVSNWDSYPGNPRSRPWWWELKHKIMCLEIFWPLDNEVEYIFVTLSACKGVHKTNWNVILRSKRIVWSIICKEKEWEYFGCESSLKLFKLVLLDAKLSQRRFRSWLENIDDGHTWLVDKPQTNKYQH